MEVLFLDKMRKGILGIVLLMMLQLHVLYANTQNVIDDMGYLSEDEQASLQATIETIQTQYLMDAVIVITDDTQGKSSMEFADDFFDYNGYGIGEEYDGILLLVNMGARELWISTTGSHTINQYSHLTNSMVNSVSPYLSDSEYYEAGMEFLNLIIGIENEVPTSSQNYSSQDDYAYDYSDDTSSVQYREETVSTRVEDMVTSPWPYLGAIIIASVITGVITGASKGSVTITNRTYEKPGSFSLTRQTDRFIRENTTRVKIETKSSSSSGGGTHTGSSGRSHGGSGGSF